MRTIGKWVLCGGWLYAGVVSGQALAAETQFISSPTSQFSQGETAPVTRVIDGDSLVLQGGLKVSLFGIQTPKMAWPNKGYAAWPLSDEAKTHLENLIQGKNVTLYYSGDKRDRYGRALAQVWTLNAQGQPNIWLQEAMVKAGYARVYSWSGQTYDTHALYEVERVAREETLGIWDAKRTKNFYAIRDPDPKALAQHVDSVQIIEGRVVSSADVRGTIYLNFGNDYKTDFTVAIAKKSRKRFKKAGYDPLALDGVNIRVRGWVELQNGPIIWLDDPRRLEVLK